MDQKILGILSQMQGQMSQMQGQMSQMQGKMDQMQGQMDQMQGQVNQIQGKVDLMETNLSTLIGDVASIKVSVERMETQQHEDVVSILERIDGKVETIALRQDEADNVIDVLAARTIRLEAKTRPSLASIIYILRSNSPSTVSLQERSRGFFSRIVSKS